MFLRALRVFRPQFLDNEIDLIYNIEKPLKYPKYFLNICFTKTFYKITSKFNYKKGNILSINYKKSQFS